MHLNGFQIFLIIFFGILFIVNIIPKGDTKDKIIPKDDTKDKSSDLPANKNPPYLLGRDSTHPFGSGDYNDMVHEEDYYEWEMEQRRKS